MKRCDGGQSRPCPFLATWQVREDCSVFDVDGSYNDRVWSYACGRHLHFAADEITGGERMELILERIRTEE